MSFEEGCNDLRVFIEEECKEEEKMDIENIIYIIKERKNKKASTC